MIFQSFIQLCIAFPTKHIVPPCLFPNLFSLFNKQQQSWVGTSHFAHMQIRNMESTIAFEQRKRKSNFRKLWAKCFLAASHFVLSYFIFSVILDNMCVFDTVSACVNWRIFYSIDSCVCLLCLSLSISHVCGLLRLGNCLRRHITISQFQNRALCI